MIELKENKVRLSVIGLGYIGLPTSVIAALSGLTVNGMDLNESLVKSINNMSFKTKEPKLEWSLKKVIRNKKFTANTKIMEAEFYIIVVPTPFKENYNPDLSYVQNAIDSIIPILKPCDNVIIESTCPVGTTELMHNRILSKRPDLEGKIYLAYCPERVLPGNILQELIHNDRVIGGINTISTEKVTSFYKTFVKGELHITNARTAELCKLTENASRDAQIAFANELSIICDKAEIDIHELIYLANRHPRVNILQPGAGVGGHCIAVDPYFIISEFPEDSKMIKTSREVNDKKTSWCIQKIIEEVNVFEKSNGKKPSLAFMGLAFKPNVDDLRQSPSTRIAQEIMSLAICSKYYIVEPNLATSEVLELTHYNEAFQKADIVVFSVAHDEFYKIVDFDNKIIIDFCGITNKKL